MSGLMGASGLDLLGALLPSLLQRDTLEKCQPVGKHSAQRFADDVI